MDAPRTSSISTRRRLLFWQATRSSVLPFSSSESITKPRLRDSSTRLTRPFLAWLKTVSNEGTPCSALDRSDLSSVSTISLLRSSCRLRGLSFSLDRRIFLTCSLCLMPSTCTRSSSLSSIKKGPSTDPSTKEVQYWFSERESSQRATSDTVQALTLSGMGLEVALLNSFSASWEVCSSAFLACMCPSTKASAPRFSFFMLGRLAAAAAPAAVAEASAESVMAADVVSAFISLSDLSILRELK
mmetsp:Transcript_27129/g.59999  ORF Transcript_27129/g.59999 Transcript_27129/m.59999 type:complete len:243 (+) Transcript_27129:188-916(+)